jgi:hypothetical protein
MHSNDETQKDDYLIEVSKSGPQVIDSTKSHFLFDNQTKGIQRSPRRDCMPDNPFKFKNKNNNTYKSLKYNSISNNNSNNTNMKENKTTSISFQIPTLKLNEDIIDPLKEKIEQIITENIKNREGFDILLQDPDINKFINNK